MAQKQGSIRIGPVTILVLIIVLCLSVMAVLSLATAHAESSITKRQVESTTALYENEIEGQTFLAELDGALAHARATNASVESALATLDLPADTTYENGVFTTSFEQPNGRRLDIQLAIPSADSYGIVYWRATTEWSDEDPDQVFWSKS